jgi:hypothetical protein
MLERVPRTTDVMTLEIPRQYPCPFSSEPKYNLTTQHLAMTEMTGYNATMNKSTAFANAQ